MSVGRRFGLIAGVLGSAVLAGAGGWFYLQHQAVSGQLAGTRAQLADREQSLETSEQQRRQVAAEYVAVQREHVDAKAKLEAAAQEHHRLNEQLSTVLHERGAQTKAIERAEAKAAVIAAERQTLERTYGALQAEKTALERSIMRRDAHALTRAELEQVMDHAARREQEMARISRHVEELSRAYEQVGDERRRLAEGIEAHPPQLGSSWALQLASVASKLSAQEETLADDYRDLGEGYLRMRDYARAAEAFERSVELREDPELHTRLAFLYSRFLHQPEGASRHTARSPTPPVLEPGAAAKSQQLPRSSWRHVWTWLTQ